jgi:hypothetical protein
MILSGRSTDLRLTDIARLDMRQPRNSLGDLNATTHCDIRRKNFLVEGLCGEGARSIHRDYPNPEAGKNLKR